MNVNLKQHIYKDFFFRKVLGLTLLPMLVLLRLRLVRQLYLCPEYFVAG
jgi:hypothetical protein